MYICYASRKKKYLVVKRSKEWQSTCQQVYQIRSLHMCLVHKVGPLERIAGLRLPPYIIREVVVQIQIWEEDNKVTCGGLPQTGHLQLFHFNMGANSERFPNLWCHSSFLLHLWSVPFFFIYGLGLRPWMKLSHSGISYHLLMLRGSPDTWPHSDGSDWSRNRFNPEQK